MTKREWDRLTKENLGADFGDRTAYRRGKGFQHWQKSDYLTDRMHEMAYINRGYFRDVAYGIAPREVRLATLAISTRFRAPQTWRAANGASLLDGRRELGYRIPEAMQAAHARDLRDAKARKLAAEANAFCASLDGTPLARILVMSNLWEEQKIARMIRELQSDMCNLVESGDMTDAEANEWVNRKADQWARGLS